MPTNKDAHQKSEVRDGAFLNLCQKRWFMHLLTSETAWIIDECEYEDLSPNISAARQFWCELILTRVFVLYQGAVQQTAITTWYSVSAGLSQDMSITVIVPVAWKETSTKVALFIISKSFLFRLTLRQSLNCIFLCINEDGKYHFTCIAMSASKLHSFSSG